MNIKGFRLVVAGAAVALVLTGCASVDRTSSVQAAAPAARTPTVKSTAVKSTAATPKPTGTQGAEGVVPNSAPTCRITSATAIGTAFDATVRLLKAGTTASGSPTCTFALVTKKLGGTRALISMVRNSGVTATAFAQTLAQTPHAIGVKLGTKAFFDPTRLRLQVLVGTSAVIVEVIPSAHAGTRFAAALQTALLGVAGAAAGQS